MGLAMMLVVLFLSFEFLPTSRANDLIHVVYHCRSFQMDNEINKLPVI